MIRKLFLFLYKYQFFRKNILKKLVWLFKYHHIHKRDVVRNEFQDMMSILKKDNPIIIDGGSNIGLYSMFLKMYFPKAKIYCFEPQKDIGTKENLSMFDDVFVFNNALGNETKDVEMSFLSYSEASTILERNIGEIKEKKIVSMITLDEWSAEYNISFVDILKLDLEGYDFYALQGAKKLLMNVQMIFVEVHFVNNHWKQSVPTFFDIKNLLDQHGFEFHNLYDVTVDNEGKLIFGNALFVKKQ